MRLTSNAAFLCVCMATVLFAPPLEAQERQRAPGTAIVTVEDDEYTIPNECDDPANPAAGFSTEPSRITREATGRTSMVTLRLRRWQDTNDVVVSLDRYVAWLPAPASAGGVLALELSMIPASFARDGVPTALTYDMWSSGDRPEGISGVRFRADCTHRDPEAPAYRKIPPPTGGPIEEN